MRRLLRGLLPVIVALVALSAGSLAIPPPSSAATVIAATTTCANGVDNTPGLGLICEVTILNTITPDGGSALVTVRECHGAAGDPTAACEVTTSTLTSPVASVAQCNDATGGGGGTLRCSVQVTNEFVDVTPGSSAVTINQCVGSGDGITIGCDPFPATTSGAVITQCNGSANGGTLVGLTCTASGAQASAFGVTVNQCNGSANGGGALVICSASITNSVRTVPATPAPTGVVVPTPTPTPTPTPSPLASPTATASGSPAVVARPIESVAPRVPALPGVVPEGRTSTAAPTLPPTGTAIAPSPASGDEPVPALVGLFLGTLLLIGMASRRSRRRTGPR
ncbi:MAG: hypothetical protein HY262_07200 [Chloroflexi bacterium]|nr:hypothetical protein [Chloroflexota bacterium]